MNKLETAIYGLVKKFPRLKQQLRNAYQGIFDLMNCIFKKRVNYFSNEYMIIERSFWGFHDISPFNNDSTMLLIQKLPDGLDDTKIHYETEVEIGCYDFNNFSRGEYRKLSYTKAWNYHKGSRLQWLNEHQIIYNSWQDNLLRAEIYDLKSNTKRLISYPIDSISQGKKLATSFSYSRLEYCMPGYGYAKMNDEGFLQEPISDKTGLSVVDLISNESKLLVSIKQIYNKINITLPDSSFYFVTHTEFSYNSDYIAFLFRAIDSNDPSRMKRKTKLVVYSFIEKDIFILPSELMVSHFVWNEKAEILAYCQIGNMSGHAIFDLTDINSIKYKFILPTLLNSDGHQSFISNSCFVTDTYPDKNRMSKVYKVCLDAESSTEIVSVYSPKKYQTKTYFNHIACDLHPRVSRDGKYLTFDTCFTGSRSICIMKL